MIKIKRFRKLVIIILTVLLILTPGGTAIGAPPLGGDRGNGDIGVYVSVNGEWIKVSCLNYNEFLQTKKIDLAGFIPNQEEFIDIKLIKIGGGAGHLDAVILADKPPIQVQGQPEIVQKLIRQDYDLAEITETGMAITFKYSEGSILSVTARIEGERISEIPFQFPLDNMYQNITENANFYSYRLNSALSHIIVDGNIEEVADKEPFMQEFVLPSTGHPPGTIYTWAMNDEQNLYVSFDVTPDNTMDGAKDYAKVYVKTPEGVKEYKVTVQETQWGQPGFIYTSRVDYQHKAYEFMIPLSDLGFESKGQVDIPLAFSAYGTMAAPPEASFRPAVNYNSVGQPYGITKGDFNNDGNEDLAVTNTVSGTVSIIIGNGDGTFQATLYKDILIGGSRINPLWITAGRFNGDAFDDLVVTLDFRVAVLLANGDGTFSDPVAYTAGTSTNTVITGDFNGDGYKDLVVSNQNSNDISVLLGIGDGTFAAKADYPVGAGAGPARMAMGDFNADGDLDLAVVCGSTDKVAIMIGDGNGAFTKSSEVAAGTDPIGIVAQDIDSDGVVDLTVANFDSLLNNMGYATVLHNIGAGVFAFPNTLMVDDGPVGITVGDYNGDTKIDLAITNRYRNSVSVLRGSGLGMFWDSLSRQDFAVGESPMILTTGDFNNDGKADLAVVNNNDGNVSILLNGVADVVVPSWPFASTLTASNVAATTLTLTWSAATDNEGVTAYKIYQDGAVIGSVAGNVLTYNVAGLTQNTAYTFKVEAGDASNNWSANGPSANATTLAAADIQVPIWGVGSSLTASNVAATTLTLTWSVATDNAGVTAYKIYQDGAVIGSVAGNVLTYDVAALSQGTSYTFKVEAGDAAGNWSLNGPSIVSLTAQASTARRIPIPTTATIRGKIGVAEALKIQGVNPLGLHVYAFPLSGGGEPREVLTQGDGSYQFSEINPGSYKLEFAPELAREGKSLPEWYQNARTWRDAETITIQAGGVYTADAAMEPVLQADSIAESSYNCIIRGRVRGLLGIPLADVRVFAFPIPWNGETPAGALSDQEGNYQITGLAPGNYKLGFGEGEQETGFLPEWYNNIRAWREAEVITVLPGNVYEADAVMDPSTLVPAESSAGIIRGRATKINEENGLEEALAGISVYAFRVEGGGLKIPLKAVTSADGTYELTDLTPGSYKIEFAPEVFRAGTTLAKWYDNERTWREADAVVLSPGDNYLVNYVME